ncbi:hypothetical protein A4A49_54693 [Nicotiana attenuata]|uniref:Uncharacterized protein n=1 Tax=Nicotiana attenuata TaxID=49451 RepID=A0A1J6INC8_NICAT|nr:hypothetical protein A4A49_54693 [Nicotiana attenuata]
MIPTPNINEAYAMIVQDENQRAKATSISNLEIGSHAIVYNTSHGANTMASDAGYGANVVSYNIGQAYNRGYKQKNRLYYDYYKLKGHTRMYVTSWLASLQTSSQRRKLWKECDCSIPCADGQI